MDNFCTQCGNPLNGKNKCDKCGHITSNSVIDKISHTVKNYDYKGKAEQVVKYSKDIVQSEQFQNVKNETVKRTHKFFECNINNDEDFIKAHKSSNKCLYIIFIAIAITIFLFPFYKAFEWVDGILGFLAKILSTLGLISRIVIIPLIIVLGIKYLIARKTIKEYKNENSDSLLPTIHINRKLVLSMLIACIISVPIVNKINDMSYKNFKGNTSTIAADNESNSSSEATSSQWSAGKNIDAYNPEFSKIMGAFDTNIIYAGLSSRYKLGEILINPGIMLVKSPNSSLSITTSEKIGTYIVKIEGDYKVSRGTSLTSHQSLKFYVTKSSDGTYTQEAADYETESFLALAASYFNY